MADNRHPITEAGLGHLTASSSASVRWTEGSRRGDLLDRVTDDGGRTWLRSVHTHPRQKLRAALLPGRGPVRARDLHPSQDHLLRLARPGRRRAAEPGGVVPVRRLEPEGQALRPRFRPDEPGLRVLAILGRFPFGCRGWAAQRTPRQTGMRKRLAWFWRSNRARAVQGGFAGLGDASGGGGRCPEG